MQEAGKAVSESQPSAVPQPPTEDGGIADSVSSSLDGLSSSFSNAKAGLLDKASEVTGGASQSLQDLTGGASKSFQDLTGGFGKQLDSILWWGAPPYLLSLTGNDWPAGVLKCHPLATA